MKRINWPLSGGLAFTLALWACLIAFPAAHAQSSGPNVYNGGFYQSPFYSQNGHWQYGGAQVPPAVSSCGTGPGVVVGTDAAFTITTGTSAGAACTVTPTVLYSKRPICSIEAEGTATVPVWSISAAGVISMTSGVVDSTRYHIVCFAQPGGL